MSEQRTYKVYKYDELGESARDKARDKFRDWNATDYLAHDDNNNSLVAFCDLMGLDNWDYSYGSYPSYIKAELECIDYDDDIKELTGLRLLKYIRNNYEDLLLKGKFYSIGKYTDGKYSYKHRYSKITKDWKDCSLTGYCPDYSLCEPLFNYINEFTLDDVRTLEDIMQECLEAWLSDVEKDWENTLSDEYIVENIEMNDYWFTVDGTLDN